MASITAGVTPPKAGREPGKVLRTVGFAGIAEACELLDRLEACGREAEAAEFTLSGTFRVWWCDDASSPPWPPPRAS